MSKKIVKRNTILYRDHIVKALMTEPLHAGYWVLKEDLHEVGNCNVCAVGAVLRSCLDMPNDEIDSCAYNVTQGDFAAGDNWENALENKNYLGALSIFFEDLCGKHDGRATSAERVKLARFVYDNFPARFEVEI